VDLNPQSRIETIHSPGRRTYLLPPRDLGRAWGLGFGPLAAAVVGSVFVLQFGLGRVLRAQPDPWDWTAAVLVGAVWARVCYTLLGYSAAIWAGDTRVEVTDDGTVRAVDRAGWFRVRWGRLAPGAARKFVIEPLVTVRDARGRPEPGALWLLSAETTAGGRVWLAPCYPRGVLAALAEVLGKYLARTAPEGEQPVGTPHPLSPAAVPVVVVAPDIPCRDVPDRPPRSGVELERHPDGVTLTVPAVGLVNAHGALTAAALVLAALGGAIAFPALVDEWLGNAKPGEWVPALPALLLACVGGGMFVRGLHTARTRTVLVVVGDRLLTFESGPLGSRRRAFVRSGVSDIACGEGHTAGSRKPLPRLRIAGRDGTTFRMLIGRDETELRWIATVLRQALDITGEPPE
jgi:hypothetical protein